MRLVDGVKGMTVEYTDGLRGVITKVGSLFFVVKLKDGSVINASPRYVEPVKDKQ